MTRVLGMTATLLVLLATHAVAQERAGVVTTLEGNVTVTRASLPAPTLLKFKDDVFVKDRIVAGADSVARILLGGRAVVTVREHSVVTISEGPGVSTVDVAAGRAAVAVARERMRAGDVVEVRTPNAVAGIRGTVVVAEVLDSSRSVITVLKGVVDVSRLEAGRIAGAPTTLNALQRVTVVDQDPVPPPQRIPADAARRLGQDFRLAPPRTAPPAATAAVNTAELERASREIASLTRRDVRDSGVKHAASDEDRDGDGGSRPRRDAELAPDVAEADRGEGERQEISRERKNGRERIYDAPTTRERALDSAGVVKTRGPSAPSVSRLGDRVGDKLDKLKDELRTDDRSGRRGRGRD